MSLSLLMKAVHCCLPAGEIKSCQLVSCASLMVARISTGAEISLLLGGDSIVTTGAVVSLGSMTLTLTPALPALIVT